MINPTDIDLPALSQLPLKFYPRLPAITVLYFCTSADEILYIGRSKNLSTRWRSHHKSYELSQHAEVLIHWLPIDAKELTWQLERTFIQYFQPKLNNCPYEAPESQIYILEKLISEVRNDPDLTGECCLVLFGLISCLDWDKWITISLTHFAAKMEIKPQKLTPIFKFLEGKNILQRRQKNSVTNTFRFNPQILYKGDKLRSTQ